VPGPDGKLHHAAAQINAATVMLYDDFPEMTERTHGESTTAVSKTPGVDDNWPSTEFTHQTAPNREEDR
jgi:uncharacterized glyoxalase superfamily protein PhnB